MAELDTRYQRTTDFLQSHASKALMEASNARRRISADAKPDLSAPRVDIALNKPNMEPPAKFSDLFPNSDGTATEVVRLNNMVDKWIDTHFPAINGCFKNIPEDWLCGVISGVKPFGLDETVFELVWHRARDQEHRTFKSDEAELRAAFSERGFSIPPGAYVRATDRLKQRGEEAVSEVNRQEAIRHEDIKVQLLQFAVEQANQYKMAVMNSLAEFYRMWATIPDKDIERAKVRAQAYSSLYTALGSYYNVELAFEELRLKAETADAEAQLSNDQHKVSLYDANNAATALGNAVRGFAQISGDAANAAGSLIAQIEGI